MTGRRRADPAGLGRFVIDGGIRVSVTRDSLARLPGTLRAAFFTQLSVDDLETLRLLATAVMRWALENAAEDAVRVDLLMREGRCALTLRADDAIPPPPRALKALLDAFSREWTFTTRRGAAELAAELHVDGAARA